MFVASYASAYGIFVIPGSYIDESLFVQPSSYHPSLFPFDKICVLKNEMTRDQYEYVR